MTVKLAESSVFVAGHRGLVGSAVAREISKRGCGQLLTAGREELELTDQAAVNTWFAANRPDIVVLAAAKVGGIHANSTYPADFIYDNLAVQTNVIHAAWQTGCRRLVFMGSSCIYPREAPQPMPESCLLTGPMEPTNEAYAIAKIAGLKTCEAYRRQHGFDAFTVMPTNLYGPGDNFEIENSHVLPALIRRFDDAVREQQGVINIWGTGTPRREFLHVDDLGRAVAHLIETYDGEAPVNIGYGEDVSIAELARLIAEASCFRGEIRFDPSKPDGPPRKLLDVSRLRTLGWEPRISLEEGIRQTRAWYREHRDEARS